MSPSASFQEGTRTNFEEYVVKEIEKKKNKNKKLTITDKRTKSFPTKRVASF